MNGINQHSLSKECFKLRVKIHPGAIAEDIWDHLMPETWKKPDVVIIHAGTYDLTSNTKS